MASIYDFSVKNADGSDFPLKDYEGKVVIIVNTATGCGFTPQYEDLEKLYEKYHDKGFEIFAVSLDTDKAAWANIVKNQQLPWINVNDGLGSASSAVGLYSVTSLPQSYLLLNGKLYDKAIKGDSELQKILDKNL